MPTEPSEQESVERERFEKWAAASRLPVARKDCAVWPDRAGKYQREAVQLAWEAWKEARGLT